MTKARALFFVFLIVIIYLIGATKIDLMDNDATQYATISMQMSESGDYLEPKWRDWEYLDKPPLLFWLSAWFFSIFGPGHFMYRLPTILINILGIYSTYRLGKKLYNEKIGLFAAIIYASSFGILVVNHDVRTDTILTGFVVFSLWQLTEYLQKKKALNFVLAFLGIGLSMLTKGPIGLMVPVLALGPQLVYQGRWKDIFRPEWLLGLVIVAITLIPMVVGLYYQHGMEGVEFFFWTQSFGRLTGENYWVDNSGPFFFVHSFLWSFIPWTILSLVAYFKKWILFFKPKKGEFEIITLSGITLVFIGMSMSSYKLPHYIYVVFPLVAILTASYIDSAFKSIKWEGFGKAISVSQIVFNVILWIAVIGAYYIFPGAGFFSYLVAWFFFSLFLFSLLNSDFHSPKIFMSTFVTILGVAFVLNTQFYPGLNPYQAGPVAGREIKKRGITNEELVVYKSHRPSIDFYSGMILIRSEKYQHLDSVINQNDIKYIFTGEHGLNDLMENKIAHSVVTTFDDFHISTLTLPFINPKTRAKALHKSYLLEIE